MDGPQPLTVSYGLSPYAIHGNCHDYQIERAFSNVTFDISDLVCRDNFVPCLLQQSNARVTA